MGRLSTTVVSADFIPPDDVDPTSTIIDYELGGVALSDSSAGLMVQTWTSRYDPATGYVLIGAGASPEVELFYAPGVSDLSFTFDQNMRPFHAYVQSGQAKFRWYDTVLGANRITSLDAADRYPKCCMDDKRDLQTVQGSNDIILAYMRGSSLYYRQQRDRYEVEYLLQTDINGRLLRVGMNVLNRLQFMFEEI